MAIVYCDRVADAAGTVFGSYTISGSNNQFSISIDGGSAQVFTLTSGTRTAAQIVADLSALTSATASVATINGLTCLRIRTTSANGPTSTILVNAPANNANATLGFVATTYTGGDRVQANFLGDTKANLANGLEDALNSAGWITVSGHHSAPIVMQSALTPANQNLRMQVTITTTNTNTVGLLVRNTLGTKVAGNPICLLPAAGKAWRVLANKYQVVVIVPYSNSPRDFAIFGVPYVPPFMEGVVWEFIHAHGNATGDTDATFRGSMRSQIQVSWQGQNSNVGAGQLIWNNNISDSSNAWGTIASAMPPCASTFTSTGQFSIWYDGSLIVGDAILLMSGGQQTGFLTAFGQWWEAFSTSDYFAYDVTLALDSHNFHTVTIQNGGGAPTNTSNWVRGAFLVATP